MTKFQTDNTVDTLRVDEKSLTSLYANLDKRGGGLPRDNDGYKTKPIPAILGLLGADSQVRPYRVSVRTLSEDWCTVLIGMYIHPDKRATITIPTANNEKQIFEATVTDCAHVSGKFHEARLQVETKIEVVEFIGGGPRLNDSNDATSSSSGMPPSADITQLLEAASSLSANDSTEAFRILMDVILKQAERFQLQKIREAVEQITKDASSDNVPDPSDLASLDAAVQALTSG